MRCVAIVRRHVFSSSVLISSLKLTIHIWKTVCESWDFDGGVTEKQLHFFWDMMPHTRYLVADIFIGHNVFNFRGPEICEEIMFLLCTKRLLLRFNCTCSFIINIWYLFTHKHGYPYINVVSFNQFIMKNTVLSAIQYVDIAFSYIVSLSFF
jgi:hypothetical protein